MTSHYLRAQKDGTCTCNVCSLWRCSLPCPYTASRADNSASISSPTEIVLCLRSDKSSITTNDARCTRVIKPTTAMVKASFNKQDSFHQQTGLQLKEETSKVLQLERTFVWCWNCTLRKVDQKYLEILKCGAGEGWRRSFGQTVWEMKKRYRVMEER